MNRYLCHRMKPLFSIVTITYNAESTLPPTMKSVAEQTCRDFEHIIVDGKSSDSTVDIAEKLGTENINIISEPDRGLYDAMNKGIARSNGKYLIFLNAGDSFHSSDTLQIISDTIADNDSPDIVYGQTQLVDSSRIRIADRHLRAPERLTVRSFSKGMLVCHQAFVAKREIAENYDLSYRFSADYDWCIKCLKKSRKNVYIPDILIDYLNEGVTTANLKASLKERFRIMRNHYGLPLTVVRHISFVPRALWRKLKYNSKQ